MFIFQKKRNNIIKKLNKIAVLRFLFVDYYFLPINWNKSYFLKIFFSRILLRYSITSSLNILNSFLLIWSLCGKAFNSRITKKFCFLIAFNTSSLAASVASCPWNLIKLLRTLINVIVVKLKSAIKIINKILAITSKTFLFINALINGMAQFIFPLLYYWCIEMLLF